MEDHVPRKLIFECCKELNWNNGRMRTQKSKHGEDTLGKSRSGNCIETRVANIIVEYRQEGDSMGAFLNIDKRAIE